MPFLPGSALRRLAAAATLALVAVATVPAMASAATPAGLRMLGTEHPYRSVTVMTPEGTPVTAVPSRLRLRLAPSGAAATEPDGFCVDLRHHIGTGTDYDVSLRSAADDAALAGTRYAEAAWLTQQADAMIAAVPSAQRPLEAGALQVAVWQLSGQVRESSPTDDAALNARTAAIRALASGRAVGGAVTVTPVMSRGCAGRSTVALLLTGVPGSSADLSASGAVGVVAPAQVRFGADGTARATVASARAGSVTVTVRAQGGTLVRLARARSSQTTPQETIVVMPSVASAGATVVFEDCPSIPLGTTPTTPVPATPSTPGAPLTPADTSTTPPSALESPTAPLDTTSVRRPPSPTDISVPYGPNQTAPRFAIRKSGPARAAAGARVRYTIRVVNRGSTVLRGLRIADDLPEGMSLASTPAGAALRGGRLVWSIGAIAPGASLTLGVRVRIDAGIAGRRCNRATATAPGGTTRTATSCVRIVAVRRSILPPVTA